MSTTPKFPPLSERQEAILSFIATCWAQAQSCPTVREIGQAVGIASPSSVKNQLDTLRSLNYLLNTPRLSRTLQISELGKAWASHHGLFPTDTESLLQSQHISLTQAASKLSTINSFVTDTSANIITVPLAGRIAAGSPITAEQNIEDYLTLPTYLTGSGELFALTVQGDSMIDAAICDGDIVVIRAQPSAENGEIVAAMLDGEATVKVLSKKENQVWLLPRNSAYQPIPANDAIIIGKVVSVLRAL